jgi:hypothetical protein
LLGEPAIFWSHLLLISTLILLINSCSRFCGIHFLAWLKAQNGYYSTQKKSE